MSSRSPAVIYQAASIALSYPDEIVLSRRTLIEAALAEAAPRALPDFGPLLDWWKHAPAAEIQTTYVNLFDLNRRQTLYLTYWTDGDTRRRGQVLADVKQRYRESGLSLSESRELPDYLPVVLEFARHRLKAGSALLQDYRASLELIRLSLQEKRTPYAGVLVAICATLPGTSPADRQHAMAMASAGPPRESVGLEPYDPRLLPLADRG